MVSVGCPTVVHRCSDIPLYCAKYIHFLNLCITARTLVSNRVENVQERFTTVTCIFSLHTLQLHEATALAPVWIKLKIFNGVGTDHVPFC